MFHFLHRVYVLAWTVLIVGGLAWIYPKLGVSEPLQDWVAVWRNNSDVAVKPVGEVSGTVVKVIDGASFTLRGVDTQLYSIALFGVTAPLFTPNSAEGELAKKSKAHLSDLVLSNEVRVTLTWIDPQRRGVGVVHAGVTNINAAMVESGLVQFKRKLIKGLALRDQYALIRADRLAKEQKLASAN